MLLTLTDHFYLLYFIINYINNHINDINNITKYINDKNNKNKFILFEYDDKEYK